MQDKHRDRSLSGTEEPEIPPPNGPDRRELPGVPEPPTTDPPGPREVPDRPPGTPDIPNQPPPERPPRREFGVFAATC